MNLFHFLRQQPSEGRTPEQAIRRLVDYMPDFYQTQRQFVACVEYLEQQEWELALDSLIELAGETQHYFAEEYWLELADAADKMNLFAQAAHCRAQIRRNEADLKSKTPFGWTTVKIDNTRFQHYISEKLRDE